VRSGRATIIVQRQLFHKHSFEDVNILRTFSNGILTNTVELHRSHVHLKVLSWQAQKFNLLLTIEVFKVVILDYAIDLKQDVVEQSWIHC
jgi:hypothetical protein